MVVASWPLLLSSFAFTSELLAVASLLSGVVTELSDLVALASTTLVVVDFSSLVV